MDTTAPFRSSLGATPQAKVGYYVMQAAGERLCESYAPSPSPETTPPPPTFGPGLPNPARYAAACSDRRMTLVRHGPFTGSGQRQHDAKTNWQNLWLWPHSLWSCRESNPMPYQAICRLNCRFVPFRSGLVPGRYLGKGPAGHSTSAASGAQQFREEMFSRRLTASGAPMLCGRRRNFPSRTETITAMDPEPPPRPRRNRRGCTSRPRT